jgi:hypothetical protein
MRIIAGRKVNILEDHNIGHSKQKYVDVHVSYFHKRLRGKVISLYSSKFVAMIQILHTVYNTGIYYASDKVGTVYLVQYIFENSTVHINSVCNLCENLPCCSSECI